MSPLIDITGHLRAAQKQPSARAIIFAEVVGTVGHELRKARRAGDMDMAARLEAVLAEVTGAQS